MHIEKQEIDNTFNIKMNIIKFYHVKINSNVS